jgi:hypothetical protein
MDNQAAFSSDEMMTWIHEMAAFGARRAGSPGGLANEDYLVAKLTEFGLANVRKGADPGRALSARQVARRDRHGAGDCHSTPSGYPTAGSLPPTALSRSCFRRLPEHSATLLTDRQGQTDIEFLLDVALIGKFAMGKHDPDNSIKDVKHPATWVRLGWHLYRKAFERGAIGFIGILKDQPGGSYQMYAPYGFKEKDILDKPLPGFWVIRDDGAEIRKLASSGANVRLTLTGERTPSVTHNVVGEISGEIDESVILHCHHDSPFVSPVEDASGCSVILALARHFAHGAKPRRNIIVLFTAGHFYGSIGTRRFIEDHAVDVVPKVALEITVEHVAKEAIENEAGELVESGRAEGTGVFLPFNQAMIDAVLVNLKDNGVDRAFLLPPEGPLGPYPPTDGGDWYLTGVPLVNFISNPVYLPMLKMTFIGRPAAIAKVAGASGNRRGDGRAAEGQYRRSRFPSIQTQDEVHQVSRQLEDDKVRDTACLLKLCACNSRRSAP